ILKLIHTPFPHVASQAAEAVCIPIESRNRSCPRESVVKTCDDHPCLRCAFARLAARIVCHVIWRREPSTPRIDVLYLSAAIFWRSALFVLYPDSPAPLVVGW